jgi:tRNA(adenine34) deaminase
MMKPAAVDSIRTPDSRFESIPDYPWKPNYLDDLEALQGLRLHYLDEGRKDASFTYLCLHGNPAWSYLYRKMIPVFLAAGHRVIAPDLIGFGKSDKPLHEDQHQFGFHRNILLQLVERLDLKNLILVVQDWGGILGLTLPMESADRYAGLLVMNTALTCGDAALSPGFLAWRSWCAENPNFNVGRLFSRGNPQMSESEWQAYNAPFPDAQYRAALRAFPKMVPEFIDSPGADVSRAARQFWQQQWQGKSMMAIGMQDPVLGEPTMRALQSNIRGCNHLMLLADAGHFVQEHGETIAKEAVSFFN